jgi:phosphoglycerate dehydrogenase-like enzyme
MNAPLLVTIKLGERHRQDVAGALGGAAEVVYLTDLAPVDRAAALSSAGVVLARNTGRELQPGEAGLLAGVKLIQFMTAGVDYIPLNQLPPDVPVACNGGAYAELMAEHAVGMALAAAKRLLVEHEALKRGEFNQFRPNRKLGGGVFGVYGFGGIGVATARLMRAFGMRVHAVNRRGASEEPTDWIGKVADLDELLAVSDVLLVATPLTPATRGSIGARELALMKPDAILLNLARGEVIDEAALYAHLLTHPDFVCGIDAWWVEPVRQGEFRMDFPFMTLPNVIGSPHNSASSEGSLTTALGHAVANSRRVLEGRPALNLIGADERAFQNSLVAL